MNKIFDWFYDFISYVGMLPKKLTSGLIKEVILLFKSLFKVNKSHNSQPRNKRKKLIEKAIIGLVVAGIVTGILFVSSVSSDKVNAIELTINDNVVGYANSLTEIDVAKAYALKVLGNTGDAEIETKEVKTEPCNIKTANALSHIIVNELGQDLIPVYEIYISDKLFCAVADIVDARTAVNEIYQLTQKLYPDSTVSFSQRVHFKPTYYTKNNKDIYSQQQLRAELGTAVKYLHAKCEEKITQTSYETVEVQTNTLFVGDSRVRREGENGSDYTVSLVKYVDNQKVLSEHLLSYSINDPVTKIIERGIRAQSLSMGSYTVYQTTGMFCWPVVDLKRVTSPFGHRRMGYHRGIDISGANASGKLIVAGAAGTIVAAGWNNQGYGNYVRINHGNGVETLYAHMLNDSIMVSVGDKVQRGQPIGRVGNTGNSFGAHLHFEVRINGNRINPAPYIGLQ